eukprot:5400224-Pyramimonas_sp.AAC.1
MTVLMQCVPSSLEFEPGLDIDATLQIRRCSPALVNQYSIPSSVVRVCAFSGYEWRTTAPSSTISNCIMAASSSAELA